MWNAEKVLEKLAVEHSHKAELLNRLWEDYTDYKTKGLKGEYVLWHSPNYSRALILRDGKILYATKPRFFSEHWGERREYPSYGHWRKSCRVAANMTTTMTQPGKRRFWRAWVEWQEEENLG